MNLPVPVVDHAIATADAAVPVVWLLGKTQSGKTSIVAEITGRAHDEIGRGFAPMTRDTRVYAYPPEQPVLRFMDTRGLGDAAAADPAGPDAPEPPAADGPAATLAHLVLVVMRVDDLAQAEVLATLRAVLRRRPALRVIVAQTGLHRVYGADDRHRLPYPFDGSDADAQRPGVPHELGRVLLAQRRLCRGLPGTCPPLFVPLDFTRPEQGVAPADYGIERLWDALEATVPQLVAELAGARDAALTARLRTRVILPWAVAAAATNAVPLPMLGGLGSASLQAAMVAQLAARFGLPQPQQAWGELAGALGTGFLLGFGARWLVQQGLKLGVGVGSAIVAAWTFAITLGIGEAALYYLGERAAGREFDRAVLRARYALGLREARRHHARRKAAGDPPT